MKKTKKKKNKPLFGEYSEMYLFREQVMESANYVAQWKNIRDMLLTMGVQYCYI